MNRFSTAILILVTMASFACGGGSTPNMIQGAWNADLSNPDGTTAFTFTATLTQSGKTIDVTRFTFVSPSQCFGKQTTEGGFFMNPFTTHGVTSGTFGMTVQSDPANPDTQNTLVLSGEFQRNIIWGTWKLTQPGVLCNLPQNSNSGNFVMSPVPM